MFRRERMNNTQAKQLTVLSAVLISTLIFLFLPSEIYLRNPREFISTAPLLLGNLSIGALLFALGLALPGLAPFSGWRKFYAIVIAGAFLALWVSGVFLVADLGELDGTSFDLSRHVRTLTFHSLWFTSVFGAACFAVSKWPGHSMRAISIIGAGLVLIGAVNFFSAVNQHKDVWEPASVREVSRFSSKRNLLIVLMDSFQSDVLQEILDEDPAIRDKLDGFQFYPDTLGVAPSTYLTMPALHSGALYNNQMSLSEYYDLGVRDGSFLAELAGNGYQVDIINPIIGRCPEGSNTCTRQENLLLHVSEITGSEASRLADLGFLRAMPGLLKQWVFNGSSGPVTRLRNDIPLSGLEQRIYQANTVLELIADNLWTVNGPPTAKLVHLLNTHPPFMFDKACRFVGVGKVIDRRRMTSQTKCAMRWFFYLLDKLKAHGIYDNSMIILTSDTGAGGVHGNDDQSSLYAQRHGVPPGEFGRLIGGANPVLAIKFPNSSGPLKSSLMQAQLIDIPRTVCETLQDCTNDVGLNLGDGVLTNRERTYKYYRWKNEYWKLNRIPGIVGYKIHGPLWLASSWSRSFSNEMPVEISKVEFSDEDQPELFGMGWGDVEVNESGISKRWSVAERAELFLPLPMGSELILEFEVLTAPGVDDQEMTVRVNGEAVGSRKLTHRLQYVSVSVPAALVTEPLSRIDLEFSRLQRPEKAGRRNISVSFYQLNIFQAPDS